MADRQGSPHDNLVDPKKTVAGTLAFVNSLAGSHRVVNYMPGSPGPRAIDRWTWIGVTFGFPLFVAAWPPLEAIQHRHAYLMWLGLLGATFIHSSAAFWSPLKRHSQEIGRAIFGRLEVPVSLFLAALAFHFCGPGAGYFLAAAQVANLVQLGLIRARFRRMVALHYDAQVEAAEIRSSM